MLSLHFKISFGVPLKITLPPWIPAPGPISTIQSLWRMVSSSCSTTNTELPKSRMCFSVAISLSLSFWCKPIEGSSNTYKTPVNWEPIWVARRIRWASPPLNVPANRSNVRYSNPTSFKNDSRLWISWITSSAILAWVSLNSR